MRIKSHLNRDGFEKFLATISGQVEMVPNEEEKGLMRTALKDALAAQDLVATVRETGASLEDLLNDLFAGNKEAFTFKPGKLTLLERSYNGVLTTGSSDFFRGFVCGGDMSSLQVLGFAQQHADHAAFGAAMMGHGWWGANHTDASDIWFWGRMQVAAKGQSAYASFISGIKKELRTVGSADASPAEWTLVYPKN